MSEVDPFQNRVAVITGGAGGIGSAMARAFAARGSKIVLADIDESAVATAVKELEATGAEALAVTTDVTRYESVEALADAAIRRFGAVHLVCNNAGVSTVGEMVQASAEDWEFAMGVNFWGVVHGLRVFAPRLIEQGEGGHVLNTASMAGMTGMSWLGVYAASKFAVVGLSESLSRELRPQGIGVSVLCPMLVATEINRNSLRLHPRPSEQARQFAESDGLDLQGGVIAPDEVARRVVRGIERGDLYIFTHPEQREFLRRRAARIDAMFDDENWSP